uniref:Retrotransposon protein, putative, Ty1-copia subclass n=1 Tax=Tanacetum cinerariifolium TaxID=118510 RepID=A0A6L2MQD9_TANCI|nr:retrotransposon protein, putative, Ty1-copia subclass [Tanacetum cinerariifolium]
MGYYFYYPLDIKNFVARNAEFFENSLTLQEASGSHGLLKTDMDGNVHTFKARLVAKGYTQTYDVDYGEIFPPVTDIRAIRILLAIAAFYDYEIWHMDVKPAFLNGHLSKDVYMVQHEGFMYSNHPKKVCKPQHSIYGLKQASTSWNKIFDVEIKKIGYTQNPDKPCVYLKASGSNVAFLVLYVDDILIIGNNITMLQEVKSWLSEYIASPEALTKAVRMRKFIDGLGDFMPSNKRPMVMLCDNEPAITMANDLGIMKGARHFQRKYHYIHEVI